VRGRSFPKQAGRFSWPLSADLPRANTRSKQQSPSWFQSESLRKTKPFNPHFLYVDDDESVTSRSFSKDAGRLPRTSGALLPGNRPTKQQLPGWVQSKTAALVPEEISAREEKQRRFFEQQEMRAREKEQAEYRRRWVSENL
jgi:hypothetical protein